MSKVPRQGIPGEPKVVPGVKKSPTPKKAAPAKKAAKSYKK